MTVNSGTNCSSVGLKANMKKQGNRGIYFEYFMTGFSGGSLLLKDDVGIILWSCSHVQAPKWRSAQILLKNEQHTKVNTSANHRIILLQHSGLVYSSLLISFYY